MEIIFTFSAYTQENWKRSLKYDFLMNENHLKLNFNHFFRAQQIKMFLLQILHHKIKFAPFGLFEIDLKLFSMVTFNIMDLKDYYLFV